MKPGVHLVLLVLTLCVDSAIGNNYCDSFSISGDLNCSDGDLQPK